MTKVREIINDALIEIAVQDPSESMDANKADFGLRTLNRMVQKWNIDELMVFTVNRTEWPLIAGKQVYTIGTGGDFNTPRPTRISMASVLLASGQEIEIGILNDEEWRDIVLKTTQSTFPTKMWPTGNMPLNSLYLWPVPTDSTTKLVLYTWGKTEGFASVNDDVVFPNGYEEALVTNLALALSGPYGAAIPPMLTVRASDARAKIKGLNVDPLYMDCGFGRGSLAIQSFGRVVD